MPEITTTQAASTNLGANGPTEADRRGRTVITRDEDVTPAVLGAASVSALPETSSRGTMYHMKTTIRRLGNSQGVSIPRSILDEAGFSIDSQIEMTVDGTSIVLRKIAVHPREGWADDAALVADGPEDKEWLDADLDTKSRGELTW